MEPIYPISPPSVARIVATTDFSGAGRAAFRTALDLAARTDAALHLVHATTEGDRALRQYAPDIEVPEGAVRAWANETVGPGALDRVAFEPVVVRGDEVPPALLHYAAKVEADLVVAGTHGRRGVRRWVIGSVAERLVRFASCPVLTVPAKGSATHPGPQAPVLAAVDFSLASLDALVWARYVAWLYESRLDVLHVVSEVPPIPDFYPDLRRRHPLQPVLDFAPDLDRLACQEMERLLLRLSGPPVEARYHVRTGMAPKRVTEFARDHAAGLVVMGTRGLTGVDLFTLGSTAARTLRTAPCAVLTTRLPSVEDPETGQLVSRSALVTESALDGA